MHVKRSVLAAKTDEQLLAYLEKENRSVLEAKLLAYEILKERGRAFSDAEANCISDLIIEQNLIDNKVIHPYYKKAANLIYLSLGLGLVNSIRVSAIFLDFLNVFIALFTLGILLLLAYFAGKGSPTVKYILLGLIIIGLLDVQGMILLITTRPVDGIFFIVQSSLQVIALVFLFRVPQD